MYEIGNTITPAVIVKKLPISIVLISIRFEMMMQMQKSERRRRNVSENFGCFIFLVFGSKSYLTSYISLFALTARKLEAN